jgi:hypothetical protein
MGGLCPNSDRTSCGRAKTAGPFTTPGNLGTGGLNRGGGEVASRGSDHSLHHSVQELPDNSVNRNRAGINPRVEGGGGVWEGDNKGPRGGRGTGLRCGNCSGLRGRGNRGGGRSSVVEVLSPQRGFVHT